MRFKITFNRIGKLRMLPMDYQYYLSAWIYKVIGQADPEFSKFLHEHGYTSGNKLFKLFCYSPLNFGKPVLWKEKALFEIQTDEISLNVSFCLAEAAEKFIIGLFNNQQVYIGDRFNGIDLIVKQIERMPDSAFSQTMSYKAGSPVVVSVKTENEKYPQYLAPTATDYAKLLQQNILNKYQSVPNQPEIPEVEIFKFELKGTPKSKLITIKPYTPEQSKVRGFLFDFKLTCPVEIHQVIMACGLGEKNSTGFGWICED